MLRKKLGNGFVCGIAGLFAAAFAAINLTGIITLIVFLFSPLAFAGDGFVQNEQANAACLSCHGKAGFGIERNDVKQDLFVDPDQYKESIHGTRTCISCHDNLGGVPHTNILAGRDLSIQVNNRCQACHADVAALYTSSAHGMAVGAGKDGALCKDCHGVHTIRQTGDPASSAYRLNVPQTCTKCHQGNVQKSYDYSFHGSSVKLGYEKGATCADCHGVHQILGPENPASTVSKEKLPQTSGKTGRIRSIWSERTGGWCSRTLYNMEKRDCRSESRLR